MAARHVWWGMTVLCAVLAAGCTGLDPYREPPAGAPRPLPAPDSQAPPGAPGTAPGPAAPVAAQPGPAAAHLLREAETHAAGGDYDRAAAQIERAMRIERGNPWLYLALADVRFAQGDAPAARALLNRARSLSGGDPRVAERAELLGLRDTRNASPP